MDILSFYKGSDKIRNTCSYSTRIGDYTLRLYTGKWDITTSKPTKSDLNFDEYEVLGVAITDNENCRFVEIKELLGMNDLLGYLNIKHFYNLKIKDVERVYNKLYERAGISVQGSSNNKEKPCRCCGRMNDIGSSICWGFTCGVNNPTEK